MDGEKCEKKKKENGFKFRIVYPSIMECDLTPKSTFRI